MQTDLAGPALGLLGACAALLVFPPLFERLSGWPQLVSHFGLSPVVPTTSLGYASLGRVMSIPVELSASPQGLVVKGSFFPPWRAKHIVLVPWNLVSQRGFRSSLFGTRFVVAAHRELWLFAKPRVAQRLRSSLAVGGGI